MKCFTVVFSLLITIHGYSQDWRYTVDTIHIESVILKESRSFIMYKPKKLLITDSVRFIYLLDGENSNYRFQYLLEKIRDSVQNLVAIGIINTDRRRDLLYIKQADKFLDFITIELMPFAEQGYKIRSRTLYGHSFGGAFAVYSLVTRPGFFNCYIASSPTPIMDLIKTENFQHADSVCKRDITFYFSCGSKDLGQVRKWVQRLHDNLQGAKFEKLSWRFEIFKDKDHNNGDMPALYDAFMSFIEPAGQLK